MEGCKEGVTAQTEGMSDTAAGRLCCVFELLMIEGKWIPGSVEGTIKDDISLKGGLVWIDRRGHRAAASSAIGPADSPTRPGPCMSSLLGSEPWNKDRGTRALLPSRQTDNQRDRLEVR